MYFDQADEIGGRGQRPIEYRPDADGDLRNSFQTRFTCTRAIVRQQSAVETAPSGERPALVSFIQCFGATILPAPLPGSMTALPLVPCQQYQEVTMPRPKAQRPSRRPALIKLMLLLLVTVVGVSKVTVEDIHLGEAAPPSTSLAVDEETYYRFVAPRLDRMVVEVDGVAEMVNDKSRDIIALTISANRIETLSEAIVEFGEQNGVPE